MTGFDRTESLRGWALPGVLVLIFATLLSVPPAFGPGASIGSALVLAIPAAVLAWLAGQVPSAGTARALLASVLALGALALSAALSANPWVAFAGKLESRTGWAMWAVAWVWLWVASTFESAPRVRRISATVALIGAAATAAALMDAFGLTRAALSWSDKPAGLFENALSLGQFLVLAVGCAAGWLLSAKSLRERAVSSAVMVLCAGGIVLSGSRGALLGAAVGTLLAVVISGKDHTPLWLRRGAVGVLAVGAAAVLVASVVSVAAPKQAAAVFIDDLFTGRPTLWRAAIADFTAAPLLGQGPGMYSSFATWGLSSEGALSTQWANDPHSSVLYMLAGGGLVGMLIAGVAAVMLMMRLVTLAGRSVRAAAVVAGLLGWFVSTLFTWVNPFSLVAVALVAGVMLREDDVKMSPPAVARWTRIGLGAAACVMLVTSAFVVALGIGDELRWAVVRVNSADQFAVARDAASRSQDPTYAVWLLTNGIPQELAAGRMDPATAATVADGVLRQSDGDVEWYAPLALASVENVFRARAMGTAPVDLVEQTIVRARLADPGSGCFDFVAADRFASLGLERRALAHARAALDYPLSPEVRAKLERFAGPQPRLP